ncbi:MAG: enoyl-CoA hydratase [marine bacterium B5-7]|nr:MAG: enoyl-CoA hydratase [marine bacterium B5-7]
MIAQVLKVSVERDDRLLRLTLSRPKANIVDAEMIDLMQSALDEHVMRTDLLAILIDADGPHFSFGASVEEHLPDRCAAMLSKIHKLVMSLIDSPVPVLAAVQGMCLGGGMEVVLGANRIFASDTASFGQPEIKLGVFAPAASCLLPELIGQARAEDLLFTGRTIDAATAHEYGLVDVIAKSPADAAIEYFDKHLSTLSGFSLRQAVQAARADFSASMRDKLMRVERQYLEQLMAGRDPVEGLHGFLEKRTPNWEHC